MLLSNINNITLLYKYFPVPLVHFPESQAREKREELTHQSIMNSIQYFPASEWIPDSRTLNDSHNENQKNNKIDDASQHTQYHHLFQVYSDWCHEFEKYKLAMKTWERKQAVSTLVYKAPGLGILYMGTGLSSDVSFLQCVFDCRGTML